MAFLTVWPHAAVVLVAFTMPGLAILRRLSPRSSESWPLAFLMGSAFVSSSLLIAAFQAAVMLLPTALSRMASWGLMTGIVAYTVGPGGRLLWRAIGRTGVWEKRMWMLLGVALLAWIGLVPLSPYPSQLTVGMGDPPCYYAVAANVVQGRGWTEGFFIGDYAGGGVPYVTNHPLPVLVLTFLFQISGVNPDSLVLYGILAAVLQVALVAVFVSTQNQRQAADSRVFLIAVVTLLVPIHFRLMALGVITLPGSLALVTAMAFLLEPPDDRRTRLAVVILCVLMLGIVRPEAALFAILLSAGWPVAAFFENRRLAVWMRGTLGVVLLVVVVIAWWGLPDLVRRLPPGMRNLSMFFLKYDEPTRKFQPMYTPWWTINNVLCAKNFSGKDRPLPQGNDRIGEEIRKHPVAFVCFVGGTFLDTVDRLMSEVTIRTYVMPGPLKKGLIGLGLLFCLLYPPNHKPMLVVLMFFCLLPLTNCGFADRHMLPGVVVFYALLVRAVLARWQWMLWRIGVAAVIVLLVANVVDLAAIRRDDRNRSYVPILRDLRQILEPGDVIACDYPQLIASETGCRAVGGTWLTPNLPGIIARFHPSIIVVDNAREAVLNYSLLGNRNGLVIPGYRLVRHDAREQYAVFVSDTCARGESPGPGEVK